MDEKLIGEVTHFYTRICVAVVDLSGDLHVGDTIHVYGRITDYIQKVNSMEVDHKKITAAGAGDEVAILMEGYARAGDSIFLLT